MKVKTTTILAYVFAMIFVIILSLMYYLVQPIYTPKVLYIPTGSINKIITHLASKDYDVCKIDSFLLRMIGSPQSGWIDMQTKRNTKADFLYKLTSSQAALQNVTLIPGETTYVFLNQLADNLHLDRKKLQQAFEKYAPLKEGVFVPDTYRLPVGITEEKLIKVLLNVSHKKMKELSLKFFGSYNEKKWFHYVTIASIIEKESANKEEMPLISSVIYNRIRKGMKLQMDGTLNYGKYSHEKITPYRIRYDNTTYNTYRHSGLPKTPVCNVSVDAIRAAIFPQKTKYLYFMKSKKGTHDFTCNYSTHLRNISRATK